MKSLLALPVLALALAACQPKAAAPDAPPAAAPEPAASTANCDARVEATWIDQETPVRRYTSEAFTVGPNCEQAIAVLVIRAREGTPVFNWASDASYIFGLKDAKDPAAMKTALAEWIDQGDPSLATTEQLPPWEETDSQPKRAEFPFMPDEAFADAAAWDQLRKDKLDMFCFTQGSESMKCVALRDGQIEPVGLQLFPG